MDLKLIAALRKLADAEQSYRDSYQHHGDDKMVTGRAWDAMRRAGQEARDLLRLVEA